MPQKQPIDLTKWQNICYYYYKFYEKNYNTFYYYILHI